MEKEATGKRFKIFLLIVASHALFNGCATSPQRDMDKGAALEATKIWFNDLDQGNDEKLWEIASAVLN